MRYITEDVPCSLVPIASVGEMFRVPTPTINSVIHLASAIQQCDYWKEGRTVERLGIAGMTLKQLRLLGIGEERDDSINSIRR
jgi:opine dehydrogenase